MTPAACFVLFCFSKKERKKEPDKELHPLCRIVPWLNFCTTVLKGIGSLMLSPDRKLYYI